MLLGYNVTSVPRGEGTSTAVSYTLQKNSFSRKKMKQYNLIRSAVLYYRLVRRCLYARHDRFRCDVRERTDSFERLINMNDGSRVAAGGEPFFLSFFLSYVCFTPMHSAHKLPPRTQRRGDSCDSCARACIFYSYVIFYNPT